MNASSKNARVVRNRIFLQFLALCVHCPSRVSLYRLALLRHQWQSPGARSIALPLLSRLAAVNARDAAWVTRAWGNGAKATIIHGQGRIAISRYKKMSAMVEGWYRRTVGPHSRRAFSSECSRPDCILSNQHWIRFTIIEQIKLVIRGPHSMLNVKFVVQYM